MNTLNFLDANVWLALVWGRHIHSERARDWLEKSPEEKFFFCRFTQLTALRLLTSATVMGSDVRKMVEAWDLWRSEEHTSELQSLRHLVCRLLLEKKKN